MSDLHVIDKLYRKLLAPDNYPVPPD